MAEDVQGHVPVVGIGASAGGIEAFRGFFENMPADSGMGFVVVLHLPAGRKSILPEILQRWTSMAVVEISDGCPVEANVVYLPPPGLVVTYQDGRFFLHQLASGELREPHPINMLFNSLASGLGDDAVGVVLSGTGSDGSIGLKAIKLEGGLTLVQGSNGTAPQHDGMPSSAIATGAVDIVGSAEALPGHILAIHRARQTVPLTELPADATEMARLAICAVLKRQVGHDFSGYKEKTFLRRVQRRMQVLGLTSIDRFVERLEHDRPEVVMLFRDLLIGVTGFFRDESTFEALKQTVIPKLFDNAGTAGSIRVWAPGCATGEEAYSLAMLLLEHMDDVRGPVPTIQVFATDIDEQAIATARMGRYTSTLLKAVSPARLARFFVHGIDGSYTVAKSVRELCTFSAHSLIRDPPFSRIDLLSCRNLLIYLDIDLQSTVIPAFHYSLVPNGILLLGSSESINRHEQLFSVLDRTHRIFQKRDVPSPPLRTIGRVSAGDIRLGTTGSPALSGPAETARSARLTNWANARVLDRFAPSFVVVTADGTSVQYSSRVTRYLELPSGLPSQNVLAMARPGLRVPLRAALRQASETGIAVEKPDVSVTTADGGVQCITLVVEPRREAETDTLFLIVFIDAVQGGQDRGVGGTAVMLAEPEADNVFEAEWRDTREQLQSLTEEHNTALEELKSANEELHSVNEELQSTNEELETSKEEIQSVNEELQTANGELASKVNELDSRNSDLKNLFDSTHVATIFLDPYMVIRGFTPAVASIYNLIPSDQGRPLSDIVSQLRYDGLREDCRSVLQTLEPLERRVPHDDDTTHYLMRILPYRTPENTVDGTVITFVDVSSIVQAEQHQRLLVDELNHRVKNMLTVVIAMASQTLRRSDSLAEFSKNYLGRIHALTAAYSLLSDEGWQPVSVRSLLLAEVRPFRDSDRANILLEGPEVLLEPRAALALGMAIHELATNAIKYGALSVAEGNVSVRWRLEHHSGNPQFVLGWTESNGPPVVAPSHRGFGMTLIERGLAQDMSAEVDVEFAPTGVKAMLRAPHRGGLVTGASDRSET